MYDTVTRFAYSGITHVIHTTRGWAPGEAPYIASYRDLRKEREHDISFTEQEYNSLIHAFPDEWRTVISKATDTKVDNPDWTLQDVITKLPPPPGTWIKTREGKVGRVQRHAPLVLMLDRGSSTRAALVLICGAFLR